MQHPIQVVARLTGLSPHVIRVWEKRYGAVTPARTPSNRRLYSELEIARLRLLARATGAGHKISLLAPLNAEDLERLVHALGEEPPRSALRNGEPVVAEGAKRSGDGAARLGEPRSDPDEEPAAGLRMAEEPPERGGASGDGREEHPAEGWPGREGGHFVASALRAISTFDSVELPRVLEQALARLGLGGLLRWVVGPLAAAIGEHWQRGDMTIAHEHFASAILREHLLRGARPGALGEGAPRAIVATPAGQLHELGAVMVAATASSLGWRPVYLGANLPATEIAGAVAHNRASVVLLSLVYPPDDLQVSAELQQLRRLVPPHTEIIVGGRAARAYRVALEQIRARQPASLDELARVLESIRERPPGAPHG